MQKSPSRRVFRFTRLLYTQAVNVKTCLPVRKRLAKLDQRPNPET